MFRRELLIHSTLIRPRPSYHSTYPFSDASQPIRISPVAVFIVMQGRTSAVPPFAWAYSRFGSAQNRSAGSDLLPGEYASHIASPFQTTA